ncbi:phytanoyl-CoA dioxygenase family protein [Phenylobacterium sp.]|uniref:phytanoyl-CoA dioxygenase family protein n=1 Tax=Phenylobacterium sp. TaxID=1871053 RepID=UPI00301DFAB4
MDHEGYIRKIESDGFAIIENAVSPEMCDEIGEEIRRLEDTNAHKLTPNEFTGFNTARYFDLLNHGDVWQRVATHPSTLPVLRGILGEDMLLSTMGTAVIGPGEPAQPLHRDDGLYDLAMPHRQIVCNTVWALTDFTEENGATRIVPGSHKWLEAPRRDSDHPSVPATMPRGSVCFVAGTLWHGGGANRSDARRWALTINYCGGAVRQQENYMLSVPRERAASFSPELQDLIGYRRSSRGLGHVGSREPRSLLEA